MREIRLSGLMRGGSDCGHWQSVPFIPCRPSYSTENLLEKVGRAGEEINSIPLAPQ